jgi:Uma2 family endonuclease
MERIAEFKSEYFDGEVYAMAGARARHGQTCGGVLVALATRLRGTACQAMSNDMRVVSPNHRSYTYPDVLIVCGKPEYLDPHEDTLLNPIAVFEVLSRTTEAHDRGKKLARYQSIPSLMEYVLVSQEEPRIERYKRDGEKWTFTTSSGLDSTLQVESVNLEIPLSEIYERVDFSEEYPLDSESR